MLRSSSPTAQYDSFLGKTMSAKLNLEMEKLLHLFAENGAILFLLS